MNQTRLESDSFGTIEVPVDALWGAQTARSLHFFKIGRQRMPLPVIHALAWVKWAAAVVNGDLGLQAPVTAHALARAALRVAQGECDGAFPLSVWQTGSGTQSNMNVNEVIARLATQSLCDLPDVSPSIHPNDDVNLGQSSNDVFPTAMHLAVLLQANQYLIPALWELRNALVAKAAEFSMVVKIGRTHLQDAIPMTLGQEFGGYAAQLEFCDTGVRHGLAGLHALAIGGTAVGTGLNTHPEFGKRVAAVLARELKLPLVQADNLFAVMAGHEALVAFHATMRTLAIALTKIANDLRLLGSGPRAGLGELQLPQNEAGSSIMPGKVNPTQIEALTMVCAQVMGHDTAIGFAASQGQLELNAYKPLIVLNTLDSVQLLSDAMRSFTQHCLLGIAVNRVRTEDLLQSSLMLATALVPHLGYDRATQLAAHAHENQLSLRDAAIALGFPTAAQFDLWVDPRQMLGPRASR